MTESPDSPKILVAEDNDFVRMQIARFLTDAGYKVDEARDGDEAIEKMDSDKIDLFIADVRMEPVDGFEFIRALRGMNKHNPVILVTGDNNPDLLEEANKWGVRAILIKPVQKDRLLKTVEKTLLAYRRQVG